MIRISAVLLLLIPVCAPAQATPRKGKPTEYLRIVRAEGEPAALQTAIVRFVPGSGERDLVVDLIGVVHFGEKSYYRDLDLRFAEYDALLYELVAPEGHDVPPKGGGESDNPFRLLQRLTQSVLGLASQLDHIDYTRKNFVHADLSPGQMLDAMQARGEDGLTLALGITADLLRQYNLEERRLRSARRKHATPQPDLLSSLIEPGGMSDLKRAFAVELVRQTSPNAGLGRTLGTILVGDRNKAAMRVFQRELAKGRKRLGIFYGAAHMPDFERRLVLDFGMKKAGATWVTAWDLRKTDEAAIDKVFETLFQEALRDLQRATRRRATPTEPPPKKRRRVII